MLLVPAAPPPSPTVTVITFPFITLELMFYDHQLHHLLHFQFLHHLLQLLLKITIVILASPPVNPNPFADPAPLDPNKGIFILLTL
jgi:hypothetical protein